jgi:chaperone required for assembly of F1-ATPase
MRDLLFFEAGDPQIEASDPDPVKRARAHARTDLPKRFYKSATMDVRPDGFVILLDGRLVKTPGKRVLAFPSGSLALQAAREWDAQEAVIDPGRMPLTRLANSILDGVTQNHEAVIAEAANYAATDLVCYRAQGPERLVTRQSDVWDRVLDLIEDRLGARFLVAEGIIAIDQDVEALARVHAHLATLDAWRLGATHVVTTLTGSVLLAILLETGTLDADAAWAAAMVDEDWNAELWGLDAEAAEKRARRRLEFDTAARVLKRV